MGTNKSCIKYFQAGATMVEYVILLVLISGAALVGVNEVGSLASKSLLAASLNEDPNRGIFGGLGFGADNENGATVGAGSQDSVARRDNPNAGVGTETTIGWDGSFGGTNDAGGVSDSRPASP